MKIKQTSKEIVGQRKEMQLVHHEAVYDELGNIIEEAYDEEVEVIVNITEDVTREVEVDDLSFENKVSDNEEPTQLDEIQAQLMYTALMTDTLLEV